MATTPAAPTVGRIVQVRWCDTWHAAIVAAPTFDPGSDRLNVCLFTPTPLPLHAVGPHDPDIDNGAPVWRWPPREDT